MGDSRLPAHLEIAAIIRLVEAGGGFATVLAKGERDAGTILLVATQNGHSAQLYERMPQLDGSRAWTLSKEQDPEKLGEFSEYLDRRKRQDSDVWILEADIADGAQFIANLPG
ncbi:DUF1491 family protein [Erythrobacter litoralis]|uniref:GTP-binding protein Era n=1 Tax=Erythrobacter litoralis (strain HTCC2594) TaxID=314225 RepID=Q2N6K7_ERYLH|nr:DUF1491 family protein [Erythrobacter litoralis]ABC64684.1 hypothetical protein ELI_12960 [Erythrobacter litoralis HTCC2594]